jgi:hypothetical protein
MDFDFGDQGLMILSCIGAQGRLTSPLAGRADCLGDGNEWRERDRRCCLNLPTLAARGDPWLISDFQKIS